MKIVFRDQPKLYQPSPLEKFLAIPPLAPDAIERSRKQLDGRYYPREQLTKILAGYNQQIGNDINALENVDRLRNDNTFCVVTGQQMGFMGSPSYTILKAISCIQLAQLTGAIPVFWAATEDHDIGEIDHTTLVNCNGNLQRFHLPFKRDGHFVEDLVLTERHLQEINSFCQAVGLEGMPGGNGALKVGDSYSRTMVRLLASLFAGTGLVFVEPYLLRPLAVPFFEKEVTSSALFQKALKETTGSLLAAGGEAPLSVGEGTNLFFKSDDGRRVKIQSHGDSFQISDKTYTETALLQLIQGDPSRLSCNASARVVLQNTLFPVLSYVGGPSEINYHHQLLDYHKAHAVPMPWVVPRLSATFIDKEAAHYLKHLHLQPWDLIPARWEGPHPEEVPSHALHYLRNLLTPRERSQERVLNWLGFQAKASENLIHRFLEAKNLMTGHYYCFYE